MTVLELIEKLKTFDKDFEVNIEDSEYGDCPILRVIEISGQIYIS